jgi:hypothetical protein
MTAAPIAEQTGQLCVLEGAPVRSAQQCSCAPRKIIASNRPNNRMAGRFRGITLARMSLGWNRGVVNRRPMRTLRRQLAKSAGRRKIVRNQILY